MNALISIKSFVSLGTLLICLPLSLLAQAKEPKIPVSALKRIHRLVELTNIERMKEGVAPLKLQENLIASATWMVHDMAKNNYFDHKDTLGRLAGQRATANGYERYRGVGENLAAGQFSPKEVVKAWLQSPGHKANLLSPYFREVGVGYASASGSTYETYWAQDFGVRREICPLIINLEAMTTENSKVQLYVHGSQWGASEMRFSNDGTNWTAWESYHAEKEWILEPQEGEKTVYAEIRNSDGDVLKSEDTIHLEIKKESRVVERKSKNTP